MNYNNYNYTKNVHTHTKIKRVAVQNHLAMHTSMYKYIYIVCSLYIYNRYSYISYIYISKICSANLKLAKMAFDSRWHHNLTKANQSSLPFLSLYTYTNRVYITNTYTYSYIHMDNCNAECYLVTYKHIHIYYRS